MGRWMWPTSRPRPLQQLSRIPATFVAHKAPCVLRERLVRSRAAGGGAATPPAATTATAATAVAPPSVSPLQPHPPLPPQQPPQQQDQPLQQQQQQLLEPVDPAAAAAASSRQADASPAQQRHHSSTAGTLDPAALTALIAAAGSLAALQDLLHSHGSSFNHIHVSAAFVRLQRLWTAAPGGTSGGGESSRLGGALLLQLQGLAQGLTRVDGRYCSNVLYCLAVLEPDQPGAYCGPLVEQICAAAAELANVMPPQELSTLVWSLAALDVVPAPQLTRRLVANILRRLPAFGPQDLAMVLTGLPRLSPSGVVSPFSTVHKLAAAAQEALPGARPQEAVLLLAALARVGYRPPPAWLGSFWAATEHRLGQLGPREVGMAGWALGQLAPLLALPPAHWLAAWEEAVAATCLGRPQQQQQQQTDQDAGQATDSSSSRQAHQGQDAGQKSSRGVALVELAQALYGWSKAVPQAPPGPDTLQQLFAVTLAAMAAPGPGPAPLGDDGSSSRQISFMLKHQPPPQQQQQQQHEALGAGPGSGVSARLVIELLGAAARWRMLPPRRWLLAALATLQQQMLGPQGCSGWEISSLLWALAVLRVKPNNAWLGATTLALQQLLLQQQQQQQQHACQQQQQQQQLPRGPAVAWAQQEQQQAAPALIRPKQLALALWSLKQLQHRPRRQFWSCFWPASLPLLLSADSRLPDIVMTLEAAQQLQAQPPKPWLDAVLKAAVTKGLQALQRRQQTAAAAGSVAEAAGAMQQDPAPDQGLQQQTQQQVQQQAGGDAPSDQPLPDLVRLAAAAAWLGAAPGNAWCCKLLDALAASTAAGGGVLGPQAVSRLLWSLAKLGFKATGGVLPGWLLSALMQPATRTTASSSSSWPGSHAGSAAAAATAAEAAAAVSVLSGYSQDQLLLLLLGLRGCGAVPGAGWMLGLLQLSAAAAAGWRLELLVALVRYVAAARFRPLDGWRTAVSSALTSALQQWQQDLQQQDLKWVPGLLRALLQLQFVPDAALAQQLTQLAAAAAPQLKPEHAALQASCVERLMRLQQPASRQYSPMQLRVAEQQQQQQQPQHRQLPEQQQQQQFRSSSSWSSAAAGDEMQQQQQQQQQHSQPNAHQSKSNGVAPSTAAAAATSRATQAAAVGSSGSSGSSVDGEDS